MVFQTAEALRRSDGGDAGAYPLLRILTPLIKFRACRDARKVTGDAMEVRGGCGYIEDWADPRLVRDAHLGSIWEGTSNIVALDVMRAITPRGRAAGAARRIFAALLADTPLHAGRAAALRARARRAALARAAHAAEAKRARRRARAPGGLGAVPPDERHRDGLGGRRACGSAQRIGWPSWCCATACCRATRWRRRRRARMDCPRCSTSPADDAAASTASNLF